MRFVFASVSQQASVHGHFPFAADPVVYLARAPFPVEVFAIGVAPQGVDINQANAPSPCSEISIFWMATIVGQRVRVEQPLPTLLPPLAVVTPQNHDPIHGIVRPGRSG
jgi:hypothetical protein